MQTFLTIVYVLVCLFLILVVLLQSGKGGGMGTALGGGSGGSSSSAGMSRGRPALIQSPSVRRRQALPPCARQAAITSLARRVPTEACPTL